jgi:hypothetical protein
MAFGQVAVVEGGLAGGQVAAKCSLIVPRSVEEFGFVLVLPGRMLTYIFEGVLEIADVGCLESVLVGQ